jgi:hypothetical protein
MKAWLTSRVVQPPGNDGVQEIDEYRYRVVL